MMMNLRILKNTDGTMVLQQLVIEKRHDFKAIYGRAVRVDYEYREWKNVPVVLAEPMESLNACAPIGCAH